MHIEEMRASQIASNVSFPKAARDTIIFAELLSRIVDGTVYEDGKIFVIGSAQISSI